MPLCHDFELISCWECMRYLVLWFWMQICDYCRKAVARSVALAQVECSCFERGTVSLRRETLALARRLGSLGVSLQFSLGEEPHSWVRGCLAHAREGSPKRVCEIILGPLSQSHLSESLQLERGYPSRLSEGP